MLSLFPIQFLAPLAYTLLRLVVGAIVVRMGMTHIRHRAQLAQDLSCSVHTVTFIAIVELLAGFLCIIGLFTQGAAFVLVLLSGIGIRAATRVHRTSGIHHPLIPPRKFFVLLGAVSLSLCITGAGIFAFDLPI